MANKSANQRTDDTQIQLPQLNLTVISCEEWEVQGSRRIGCTQSPLSTFLRYVLGKKLLEQRNKLLIHAGRNTHTQRQKQLSAFILECP